MWRYNNLKLTSVGTKTKQKKKKKKKKKGRVKNRFRLALYFIECRQNPVGKIEGKIIRNHKKITAFQSEWFLLRLREYKKKKKKKKKKICNIDNWLTV